jgi:hypothetical protein
MAGQPLKRQFLADLKKLGGVQHIADRISDGDTFTAIAKEFGLSRNFMTTVLYKEPEAKALLQSAKKERSNTLAEQCLDIVDNVDPSPNEISKAREQASVRKWLASCENPETYGQKQSAVTINVGDLHLDALRNAKAVGNAKIIENE